MSQITLSTAGNCTPWFLEQTRIQSFIAGTTITIGDAVYIDANGKAQECNTGTSGHEQFRGIALDSVSAGQAVGVVVEGFIAGFDLSGLAYDAFVYAQDTNGQIGTAAGTKTVRIGRVVPTSDFDPATSKPSKLLYVRSDMINNW
jgi:Uncharacterized conserved protein (DUF2190)